MQTNGSSVPSRLLTPKSDRPHVAHAMMRRSEGDKARVVRRAAHAAALGMHADSERVKTLERKTHGLRGLDEALRIRERSHWKEIRHSKTRVVLIEFVLIGPAMVDEVEFVAIACDQRAGICYIPKKIIIFNVIFR